MLQKQRFASLDQSGHVTISELCEQFPNSRRTVLKWIARYRDFEVSGLANRSRAPGFWLPELGSTSNEPKTNWEMVIARQKQAVGSSGHKKMDVIGFSLENFDTVGEWTEDGVVCRYVIFTAGTFKGGASQMTAFNTFPKERKTHPRSIGRRAADNAPIWNTAITSPNTTAR